MLLQMFELLNELKEGGATKPMASFTLNDEGTTMLVSMNSETQDDGVFRRARPFTGEELLLIPLDDGGQLDRMSKAFLIELNRVRKPA